MILDFVFFPLFLSILYIIGAGLLRVKPGGADFPTWFYFVAAFTAMGFLSVFYNFFAGVYSPVYYGLIGLLFVLGLIRMRRTDVASSRIFLLLGAILAPLAGAMRNSDDAMGYHLPQQLFIRQEKIILGMAHIHSRFGFSSLLEYIEAPLWVGDHYKLLSYAVTAFVAILMLFLRDMARSLHPRVAVMGVLVAASLAVYHYYISTQFASTDTPAGVMFAIAFLYGLMLLLEDAPVGTTQLTILFISALSAVAFKTSSALIVVWVAFVVAMLIHSRRMGAATLIRPALVPGLLTVAWLVRGVMLTGCLMYPLVFSCFDVAWNAKAEAIGDANGITAWARHSGEGFLETLNGWSWIRQWWLPKYWSFCAGMSANIVVVAAAYRLLFKEKLGQDYKIMGPALLFTLVSFAVWFLMAPSPRFGTGLFIILAPMLALPLFGFRTVQEGTWPSWRLGQKFGLLGALGSMCVFIVAAEYGIYFSYLSFKNHGLRFDTLTVPASDVTFYENSLTPKKVEP